MVDPGQVQHFLHAFHPQDLPLRDEEGHVPAHALLRQHRQVRLLPGGDIQQEVLRNDAAGQADQVGRDEDAAAAGRRLDQVDLVALHDELAVRDALPQAEALDDPRVQVQHAVSQRVVRRRRKDPALRGKSIRKIKIQCITDTEIREATPVGAPLHDELPAGGAALDDDVLMGRPAGGLRVFLPQFLRVPAGLHAAAALGVERLDHDGPADLLIEGERLLEGMYGPVGEERDAELCHFLPHQALVGEKAARLVADAGQAHFLSDVGDRADGDIRLVRRHADDAHLLRVGEDLFFVPDVGQQGVITVRKELLRDHRRGQTYVEPLGGSLHDRQLEIPRADQQDARPPAGASPLRKLIHDLPPCARSYTAPSRAGHLVCFRRAVRAALCAGSSAARARAPRSGRCPAPRTAASCSG